MLDNIISLDQKLFIYLNSLGSETYDGFWLIITNQTSWTPLFLVILFVIFKKLGVKQTFFLIALVAILILLSDQTSNLFKNSFQRLRPCSNPEINSFIRIVKSSNTFSFFSGHAANSMAVATFLYLIFNKEYKYLWLIFLWPTIFAYSRIYLGLHYPTDIICGYLCGALLGFLMFKLYHKVQKRIFSV